jgi:DnaJ-class molecular chaperone
MIDNVAPEANGIPMVECDECSGSGQSELSGCCSADFDREGLCTECGEECDFDDCEVCNGLGEVEADPSAAAPDGN